MYGYLCSYAGMSEVELGLLGEAWEHAQKAIEIGRRQGHGEIVGLGFRVLGDLYLRLDAIAQANDAYQQGLAAAGQHFVSLELMYRFGYTQLLLGQELGRHYLLQAVTMAAQIEMGAIAMLGVVQELSMYLLAGEQDLFETRAAWLREQVIKRTRRDVAGFLVNRIMADAAFKKSDYRQAYTLAQDSVEWYRGTQDVWNELRLLWIMEQSGQKLMIEAQYPLRLRMTEIINKIASSLRNAPLQAEWQGFREKMGF